MKLDPLWHALYGNQGTYASPVVQMAKRMAESGEVTALSIAQAVRELGDMPRFAMVRLLESPAMATWTQVRRPRSKRRRIRKKWEMDSRNWRNVPRPDMLVSTFGIVAHPVVADAFRRMAAEFGYDDSTGYPVPVVEPQPRKEIFPWTGTTSL